jgi:hypothetical protein
LLGATAANESPVCCVFEILAATAVANCCSSSSSRSSRKLQQQQQPSSLKNIKKTIAFF